MTPRIVAIDWSGDLRSAKQKIWLAEVTPGGEVVRFEGGRDQQAIVAHLIEEAARTPDLVVGLDFAFSFPAWFLAERGLANTAALWELAEREGERWLAACEPPFWGRAGRSRPDLPEPLRRTDRDVPATGGIRPKSVFQISGAGSVGTGSIRGMPMLKRLREAGFAIWPFDSRRLPLVVEIYPRVLTGEVEKGSEEARRRYLETHYPDLAPQVSENAAGSEDAFDALVSALVMAAHATEFAALLLPSDAQHGLEGQIWLPGDARSAAPVRGRYNSSKTRVAPVFAALEARASEEPQWPRRLLDLAAGEERVERPWRTQDLAVKASYYEPNERPLKPPVALLSWLVRNLDVPPEKLHKDDEVTRQRRKLAARDPATIERALDLLRRSGSDKGWHVLEGPTCPDVFLVTKDALVVIEGKRTEAAPTTTTTWMPLRHQMLRHLDAAWEIRGHRAVYGLFVVEAEVGHTEVPPVWQAAAEDTVSESAIRGSLPHRSPEERAGIAACFLGATTWQKIVGAFGLDPAVLVETVSPAPAL